MYITLEQLNKDNICIEAQIAFKELFGKKVKVTLKNINKALTHKHLKKRTWWIYTRYNLRKIYIPTIKCSKFKYKKLRKLESFLIDFGLTEKEAEIITLLELAEEYDSIIKETK